MENLLLHICCGPCSTPIIPNLKENFSISGFYYNPNIYPESEFEKRKLSAQKVANREEIDFVVPEQNRNEYFEYIGDVRKKPQRCYRCLEQRLAKTSEYAKDNGFKIFSTTLLISPFQDHKEIKEIGRKEAKKFNLAFYYADFRPIFNDSRRLALEYELYIQKFCGCKFSRRRK